MEQRIRYRKPNLTNLPPELGKAIFKQILSMTSYINYYGIEVGNEKYDMIAEKNVKEMMRSVAGLEKDATMDGTDWAMAAEQYLLAHGMEKDAIETLKTNLK